MDPARAIASLDRALQRGAGFVRLRRLGQSNAVLGDITVPAKVEYTGTTEPSPGTAKRKGTLIMSPSGLAQAGWPVDDGKPSLPRRGDELVTSRGTFKLGEVDPDDIAGVIVRIEAEFA